MSVRAACSSLLLVSIAACLLAACSGPAVQVAPPETPDSPEPDTTPRTADDADATATDAAEAELEAVLDAVWDLQMETWPTWATYEGDRRFDDKLEDLSPEGRAAYWAALDPLLARAEAIDPEALTRMSRDTRQMLLDDAARWRVREVVCREHDWKVDGLGGPQADYPMMAVFFPIRNARDLANLEARYRATTLQIEQEIANLRRGLADGYVSTRPNVERALEQVERVLAVPIDDDPMLKLDVQGLEGEVDTSGLRDAVETAVRPALASYRDVLRDEILPASRTDVGVSALPTGAECYQIRIEDTIGSGYTPEQLHQIGLDQLAWAHAGMVDLADELGVEATTAAEVMQAVGADPAHYAADEAQLMALNAEVVERAEAAVPRIFGLLPETPVEVRPIEPHRAPDAPAAYYYSASEDGSRPGYYYVNTHEPQTRPLYNLEALALHEAVPGHHLQISIAKELPEVHIWRRSAGQTAFVEGWALYAEMLGAELDLYSTPLTRFGNYNYQAWRAARLVVDTGMHAMGWSREQALEFLRANVLLPDNEAANEIDRYIAWPGQALAYMVGRLEIERLRAQAETALGDRFSLDAFHDQVLGSGAVPLDILRAHIEAWIAAGGTTP